MCIRDRCWIGWVGGWAGGRAGGRTTLPRKLRLQQHPPAARPLPPLVVPHPALPSHPQPPPRCPAGSGQPCCMRPRRTCRPSLKPVLTSVASPMLPRVCVHQLQCRLHPAAHGRRLHAHVHHCRAAGGRRRPGAAGQAGAQVRPCRGEHLHWQLACGWTSRGVAEAKRWGHAVARGRCQAFTVFLPCSLLSAAATDPHGWLTIATAPSLLPPVSAQPP